MDLVILILGHGLIMSLVAYDDLQQGSVVA